ncbi:unnamed protein product [Discosporangium mesarthrocarpum]
MRLLLLSLAAVRTCSCFLASTAGLGSRGVPQRSTAVDCPRPVPILTTRSQTAPRRGRCTGLQLQQIDSSNRHAVDGLGSCNAYVNTLRGGGAIAREGRSTFERSADNTGCLERPVPVESQATEPHPARKGVSKHFSGSSEHDQDIRALALPALMSLLAGPILSLIDTAYVGRGLGAASLAALGPCTSVFHFSFNTFRAMTHSTTTLVGSSLALGDKDRAGQIVQQMYILAGGLGVFLLVMLLTQASRILALMGAVPSSSLHTEAMSYLMTRALAGPAVLMIMVSEGVFRGHSNTRAPAVAALAAAAANTVMDPLFMFTAGMGVAGAAGATAASQYLTVVLYGVMLWRGAQRGDMCVPFFPRKDSQASKEGKEDSRGPSGGGIKALTLLGTVVSANAAMLLRTISVMASWTVATAVATRMSAATVGAHQIGLSLWLLFALAAEAPSVAVQVLGANRYLSQGKLKTARSMACRALALTLGCSLGVAFLLLGTAGVVPRWFTSDLHVLRRLGSLIPLLAAQQPLVAVTLVAEGLLVGAAEFRWLGTTTTMISALTAGFIVVVGRRWPGWDVMGIWGGIMGMFALRLAAAVVRLLDRKSGPYWVAKSRQAGR